MGRLLAILGMIIITEGPAFGEPATNELSCSEFSSVFHFIQSNHLRFQQFSPHEARAESLRILKQAQARIPETLRLLGYPMVASFTEDRLLKVWAREDHDPIDFCNVLATPLLRATYLKAFAKSLDPYSDFYLTEEVETKASVIDGDFVGVGIATDPKDDFLEITEVVEDGPADGKLLLGDKIYKIDGHTVKGLNEIEIRKRIRGQENSIVVFSGLREEKPFSVSISRGKIHQKSTSFAWMKDKVLLIRIHRFFRQTADEVEQILAAHASKSKGLILDLRSNPGGLLQGARDVIDLFISQGVVTYLRSGKGIEDQIWALRDGGYLNIPMVVLVNQGTASAAEIVAGALQDYGRALVIGQQTYGKGSVQNVYDTQSAVGTLYRGGLKITTLWYYLPSGRSVVRKLDPDISVPTPEDEKPLAHNEMPFHGPDRIGVAILPSYASGRNLMNSRASAGMLKNFKSSEELGQALLKGKFANSNSNSLR